MSLSFLALIKWRRVLLVTLVLVVALLALPRFVNAYALHVLTISLYYTILAASWNLLAGFTGQFSLAHQAFAVPAEVLRDEVRQQIGGRRRRHDELELRARLRGSGRSEQRAEQQSGNDRFHGVPPFQYRPSSARMRVQVGPATKLVASRTR